MSYKILLTVFMMLLIVPNTINAGIPVDKSKWRKSGKQYASRGKAKKSDEKPRKKNPNRNANLAFAFGLSSLLVYPLAIPAFVLGLISLHKKEPKKGFAIVGVVAGAVFILILLLFIAFLLTL